MKGKYKYRIYGLTVASELEIPEADVLDLSDTADIDVSVEVGKIPDFLRACKENGYGTWTNGVRDAWFYTPGTAQYYVEKGKRIIVQPEGGNNAALLVSMILSAAMCLILLQRMEPVIHGSAIVIDGRALIISGSSGVGKSTVTNSFLQDGVGFLADDTVRLHMAEGNLYAEPTYPQQKICRDMAVQNGYDLEKLRYIDEGRDKFALSRRKEYVRMPVPVTHMFILEKTERGEVYSENIVGGKFLNAFIDNLYLEHTYRKSVGLPPELMLKIVTMSNYLHIYRVYRPAQGDSIKDVKKEIRKLLQLC